MSTHSDTTEPLLADRYRLGEQLGRGSLPAAALAGPAGSRGASPIVIRETVPTKVVGRIRRVVMQASGPLVALA